MRLRAKNSSTGLYQGEALRNVLTLTLLLKVAASFYGEIETIPSVCFVPHLINYLSTVSIDSFYSTLKVVTKPFNIN